MCLQRERESERASEGGREGGRGCELGSLVAFRGDTCFWLQVASEYKWMQLFALVRTVQTALTFKHHESQGSQIICDF